MAPVSAVMFYTIINDFLSLQAKPAKRGSATVSFADLSKINQMQPGNKTDKSSTSWPKHLVNIYIGTVLYTKKKNKNPSK